MYQVVIKFQNESDYQDYFTRKRSVIRYIARKTGVSQESIRREVNTQANSKIYRDNLGWRTEVYWS